MSSPAALSRAERVDFVSSQLAPRAALLTRLLVRQLRGALGCTEVALLRTLGDGPRRITELAEVAGLAQPTMTILVKTLEQQGLVRRERQIDDARVVLVHLTEPGKAALTDYCAEASALFGAQLAEISDEQVEALVAATETLAEVADLLQQGGPRTTKQARRALAHDSTS
jgi:DNA-binding MarR family transcriptional regulator